MIGLHMIGAIALTGAAAGVVGMLVISILHGNGWRYAAGILLGVWFVALVGASAAGLFNAVHAGGAPAVGMASVIPVIAILLVAAFAPQFRAAIGAVPLPLYIGLNAMRVLGIFFVLLYLLQRLPAPFAPIAGGGDIAIGIAAPIVAWFAWKRPTTSHGLIWIWNALGLLDLITALVLGILSSQRLPISVFSGGPDVGAMGTLPWILIPAFLVPILFLIHIAIFARLRRAHDANGAWLSSLAS